MSITHLRLYRPITVAYSPSWLDHFKAWLDQLPGPSWCYYVTNIVPWGTFAPDMLVPAPSLAGCSSVG